MAAIAEYYVDASLGSDTGNGTKSTPWGRTAGNVIQYALDNITRGSVGDRINVKAGATRDKIPTNGLDVTTNYGSPDANQPLYIQGYTTNEGDGGKGTIDVDAQVMFLQATTLDYMILWDLDITDANGTPGTPTYSVQLDRQTAVVNCSFHGLTPSGSVVRLSSNGIFAFNHVYNCTGAGIQAVTLIYKNRFISGPTNEFGTAVINSLNAETVVLENILHVTGATIGINVTGAIHAINNSIFSDGGTGHGIDQTSSSQGWVATILSNLVEGFSGTSGVGINVAGTLGVLMKDGNAVENCETDYVSANTQVNDGTNESLGASPFADASNDDFAPVDTGSVKEGSLPGFIGEF